MTCQYVDVWPMNHGHGQSCGGLVKRCCALQHKHRSAKNIVLNGIRNGAFVLPRFSLCSKNNSHICKHHVSYTCDTCARVWSSSFDLFHYHHRRRYCHWNSSCWHFRQWLLSQCCYILCCADAWPFIVCRNLHLNSDSINLWVSYIKSNKISINSRGIVSCSISRCNN